MDGQTGWIIFYIVFGFFAFCLLTFGIVVLVLWKRRKLTFTNYLNEGGVWERKSWKPEEVKPEMTYDGVPYKFDIKKCSYDKIHRPVGHYYKGNPEQMEFNRDLGNKKIRIGTKDITPKDFQNLMVSKVLKDIFSDDEVINMLLILMVMVGVSALAIILIQLLHKPPVVLEYNNQTLSVIADGVRQAIRSTS